MTSGDGGGVRRRGAPRARREALAELRDEVVACRACPRLVEWRERVADEKRAAYEDEAYWGRPVPGFGDPGAWLLAVGLAPAAHGANRTGRMFTGDRSGDWLFRSLHRAGLASQAEGRSRDDGLSLFGTWITAAVRCAPPENRPTPDERKNCRRYLEREVDLLRDVEVIVALGGYAYRHVMRVFRDREWDVPSPMPDFGHGRELRLRRGEAGREDGRNDPDASESAAGPRADGLHLLTSYHPSQQNTFTGTLTEEMFDRVWERAVELGPPGAGRRGS